MKWISVCCDFRPTPVVPEVPVKPVISREEEVVKAEEATTQKQQAKVEATPPERGNASDYSLALFVIKTFSFIYFKKLLYFKLE